MERPETIRFYRKRLPHWEVAGGRYFVTMRIAGSIPREGEDEIRRHLQLLRSEPTNPATLERHVFGLMEHWLDRSSPVDHLVEPLMAKAVIETINHYNAMQAWAVHEFVVMPNHLHLFLSTRGKPLGHAIMDFKRWTARRAKRILAELPDPFWQREWFDHWSRSSEEDDKIRSYIQQNPVKAGLVRRFEDWPYSSWNSLESRGPWKNTP